MYAEINPLSGIAKVIFSGLSSQPAQFSQPRFGSYFNEHSCSAWVSVHSSRTWPCRDSPSRQRSTSAGSNKRSLYKVRSCAAARPGNGPCAVLRPAFAFLPGFGGIPGASCAGAAVPCGNSPPHSMHSGLLVSIHSDRDLERPKFLAKSSKNSRFSEKWLQKPKPPADSFQKICRAPNFWYAPPTLKFSIFRNFLRM